MSDSDGNRAYVITSTDRRGLVVIASTILMSWMVLCFCIRLYTRIGITGSFKLDDFFAGLGTVIGVAQVGVTLRSVGHGFGISSSLLDTESMKNSQKDAYIANLLLILGHGAAKISIIFLFRRINRDKTFVRVCNTVLTVVVLWITASELALSLQCELKNPWLVDENCDNPTIRWRAVAAFDISIEVVLFVMSVSLVWDLNMRWTSKAIVVGSFGCRLLLIPICITHLAYIDKAWHSSDPNLDSADRVILSQSLLHYSLMAATMPCLKPFVIAFNTGWGQGLSSQSSNHYYFKRSALNTLNNPAGSAQNRKARFQSQKIGSTENVCQHETHVSAGSASGGKGNENGRRQTSENDTGQKMNMSIRETMEWSVEHECIELDTITRHK